MLIASQQAMLYSRFCKHSNLQLLEYLSKIMSHMFFKNLIKSICKIVIQTKVWWYENANTNEIG